MAKMAHLMVTPPAGTPETETASYPPGARMVFDHESMAKMGMDKPPAVGTRMNLSATGHVSNATSDGEKHSFELQVTHAGLSPEEANIASRIYAKREKGAEHEPGGNR